MARGNRAGAVLPRRREGSIGGWFRFATVTALLGCGASPIDLGLVADGGGSDERPGNETGDGAATPSDSRLEEPQSAPDSLATGDFFRAEGVESPSNNELLTGVPDSDAGYWEDQGEPALDVLASVDQEPTPEGYPANEEHTPDWCDTGESHQERCGTDVDEDCDGRVDENELLGQACFTVCDIPGKWLCDRDQQQLVCFHRTCYLTPETCGNRWHDEGEQCDVSAGDPAFEDIAPLETYCRADCRWATRFEEPCWVPTEDGPVQVIYFRDGALQWPCDAEGLVCSELVRSCVPKLGEGRWYRCPRLRRAESDEEWLQRLEAGDGEAPLYPMVESDEGECHISCSTDAECPERLGSCYMGVCVVW